MNDMYFLWRCPQCGRFDRTEADIAIDWINAQLERRCPYGCLRDVDIYFIGSGEETDKIINNQYANN